MRPEWSPAPRPGGRPGPPRWFFAAVGGAVIVAGALLVLRSGVGAGRPAGAAGTPAPSGSSEAAPTTDGPAPTAPSTSPPATGPATTTAFPTSSPPSGGEVALGASCSFDPGGYGIDYPAGWFTPDDPAWACQLFDPAPFTVEPDTEPPLVAVTVYVDPNRMSRVFGALTDPQVFRVVAVESGTFADAARPGVVVETEQVEALLWPSGTRTFSVLVDRADTTIVVTTNDLVGGYETNKALVVAMAASLRLGG